MLLPGNSEPFAAVMHVGPRPTFGDTATCEVHLLDHLLQEMPERCTVETIARLRDVRTFPSADALREQIARDIEQTRAILGAR